MAGATDRKRMIERASQAVRKLYGDGKSVRASLDLAFPTMWASTGSYVLDRIIAGHVPGGVPLGPRRGKVIHVFGPWSVGKSVLVDQVGAEVQRKFKGLVLITETEGSRDPHFANAVGLDLTETEIQRPDTLEELFDYGFDWINDVRKQDMQIPIFWGIDSLETIEAAQTFQVKMSGKQGGAYEFGGGRPGKIGAGLRKMANLCSKHQTSVLMINQIRERPGVMFGKKTGSTGGKAPKFLASCEIELTSSRLGVIETNGRATARWVHAKAVKNKVSAPFASGDFLIDFNKGVQRWPGVLEMLEAEKLVRTKRNKDGSLADSEFTIIRTGEVLPLTEFIAWCARENVLGETVGQRNAELKAEDDPAE